MISYKLYSNKILDRKPECEYGAWEDWNDCTTTNGPGVKTRDRKALTIDCVSPIKTYEINKIKQNNFCMEKYESKRKIIFWQIYHLNYIQNRALRELQTKNLHFSRMQLCASKSWRDCGT